MENDSQKAIVDADNPAVPQTVDSNDSAASSVPGAVNTSWAVGGGYPVDWFQRGMPSPDTARVETGLPALCVDKYANTISNLPIIHQRKASDGSWSRVNNSAIESLFARPNDYESGVVFMNSLVQNLMSHGNNFTYATRKNGAYNQLHLMSAEGSKAHIIDDPSDSKPMLVYTLNTDSSGVFRPENIGFPLNVIHHKINPNPFNRLMGMSPIRKHLYSIHGYELVHTKIVKFADNQILPSGILTTDAALNKTQIDQLRQAINDQASQLGTGGIPILSHGMRLDTKPQVSVDGELCNMFRMMKSNVCAAFGLPLPMLDSHLAAGDTPDLEALINEWMVTGLTNVMLTVEQTFDSFFDFVPNQERLVFDRTKIKSTLYKDLMNTLGEGVRNSLLTSNEAREMLSMSNMGAEASVLRAQYQMIPLTDAENHPAVSGSDTSNGGNGSLTAPNAQSDTNTQKSSNGRLEMIVRTRTSSNALVGKIK